jgi:N4-gp56 family major capsid protein
MMSVNFTSLPLQNQVFYDRGLLERSIPHLAFMKAAQKKPLKNREGKTINFRRYPSLAVSTTPLTEATTPSAASLTQNEVSASVNGYGNYVSYSDFIDYAGIDNNVLAATQVLGENMAQTIDQLLRSVAVTGTNVRFGTGANRNLQSSANPLSLSMIEKAVTQLRIDNAPVFYPRKADGSSNTQGYYLGIIHPAVFYDLFGDTRIQTMIQHVESQGLHSFEAPELGGVMWIQSTNAPKFAAAGAGSPAADVYGTLIFGKDAFACVDPAWVGSELNKEGYSNSGAGIIVKPLGSSGSNDALNQRGSIGWKTYMGSVILDQTRMIRIETGTAFA